MFFSSTKPCGEGCAPRSNVSLIFPAFGTPAIFNFSAGAPKEARAMAAGAGTLVVICARKEPAAAVNAQAIAKVLHKLWKSGLFTMASML
jgi:hypothetical protein